MSKRPSEVIVSRSRLQVHPLFRSTCSSSSIEPSQLEVHQSASKRFEIVEINILSTYAVWVATPCSVEGCASPISSNPDSTSAEGSVPVMLHHCKGPMRHQHKFKFSNKLKRHKSLEMRCAQRVGDVTSHDLVTFLTRACIYCESLDTYKTRDTQISQAALDSAVECDRIEGWRLYEEGKKGELGIDVQWAYPQKAGHRADKASSTVVRSNGEPAHRVHVFRFQKDLMQAMLKAM